MDKRGKITPLAQYIIDKIRIRRLEKDISEAKLSLTISPFGGDAIVRQIENVNNSRKYTPSVLKKAVAALDWTMQDVLPDHLLSDDTLQYKTKVPIIKGMTITAALNSLLEEGYFDEPHDRNEITTYCNTFFGENEQKVVTDLSSMLEIFYQTGKLIKIDPDKDKGQKLIRFQKK